MFSNPSPVLLFQLSRPNKPTSATATTQSNRRQLLQFRIFPPNKPAVKFPTARRKEQGQLWSLYSSGDHWSPKTGSKQKARTKLKGDRSTIFLSLFGLTRTQGWEKASSSVGSSGGREDHYLHGRGPEVDGWSLLTECLHFQLRAPHHLEQCSVSKSTCSGVYNVVCLFFKLYPRRQEDYRGWLRSRKVGDDNNNNNMVGGL